MTYTISIFDEDMNLLYTLNKTRGFVNAIKRGIVKKSDRNFGNFILEDKNVIQQTKEYTMKDKKGNLYYIWLNLEKKKGELN